MRLFSQLFLLSSVGALSLNAPSSRRGLRSLRMHSPDEFTVAVLGDLHLDPRYMDDHIKGREHVRKILENGSRPNSFVVSLGDLGESKSVDETKELFAGTSRCLNLAREYLEGFGTPFDVVAGNHDLEGIDEYASDEENLNAFLNILGKPAPYFKYQVAEKTLLVGLGSTVFRDAVYTSHEVYIDDAQVQWFEDTIKECPAEDGWKIFVFTHAPPMGSGLRVLQENHVVNSCCWLNHSSKNTAQFIKIVRENPSIKAWFSGHFHLGQDYQDSITFPDGNKRGSCVFAQTAVMAKKSSRDGRQQSRLIRGNKNGFTISTINHLKDGEERLDATVTIDDNSHESIVYAHLSEDYDHEKWFSAYTPQEQDGCYIDDKVAGLSNAGKEGAVCWWHMACGRVLGVHNGMVLEYDPSTLSPLGLVVGKDELNGRKLAVIDSGLDNQDGAQIEKREQAVILYDDEMNITVVQPNEDGSYWRKIVRNKMIRMKEKSRKGVIIFDPDEINDSAVVINTQNIIFLTVTNTGFEPRDLLDITIHNSIETSQRTCFHLVENFLSPVTLHQNEPYRVNINFHPTRVGVFKAIIMFHFKGFTMNRFITGRSCHDMSLVQELQPTTPYIRPERRLLVSMAREDDDVIIETPEPDPEEKNQKNRRRLQPYLYPKEFAVICKSGQLSEYLYSLMTEITNKRQYIKYMQCLLWSEELQQSTDILQYNMKNVTMEVTPHLLRIQVPGLAENRPSVLKGDKIHIKYSIRGNRPDKIYEGNVKEMEKLGVLMRFSKPFHRQYSAYRDHVDVEFQLNRKTMRLCHQAVTSLNNMPADYFRLMLFPSALNTHIISANAINSNQSTVVVTDTLPSPIPLAMEHTFNLEQRLAVYYITYGNDREPYIIFGPPGTGKTSTVVGTIVEIHMTYKQTKKILVCTPSNTSADLITERLHHKGISTTHMFRHMAYSRSRDTVSDTVLRYCHFDMREGAFVFPALDAFHKYSIIITTCAMASSLYNDMVSSNYFDYVFIDESGQCTEPEVLGCFIHTLKQFGGKLILAGDPNQLGPVIHSPIARNSGLDQSLLERLTDDPSPSNIYKRYDNGYDYHDEGTDTHTMLHYNPRYIVKLVQCYRCHPEILYVPNTLFYNRDLVSSLSHNAPAYAFNNWSECINESTHFPILFDCIFGEEMQENNSPSWFNIAEIESVLYYIDLILQTSTTTTMSDIGIITPYQKQVQKIKQALRQKYGTTQADMISVGSCEQFQGQERKVIIISTVRSSTQHLITDETFNIGFLSNPRRFNVAITRAQGLLIVIGNPYMLIQDRCWGSLLRHCMNNHSVYNLPSDVLTRQQDVAESKAYINAYNATYAVTTDITTTPNDNGYIHLLRQLLQNSREMNTTGYT